MINFVLCNKITKYLLKQKPSNMKKNFLTLTSLSVIVLVAIFTFSNTISSQDKLLMESIAALADDPGTNWIDDDPNPNGGERCLTNPIYLKGASVGVCTQGLTGCPVNENWTTPAKDAKYDCKK